MIILNNTRKTGFILSTYGSALKNIAKELGTEYKYTTSSNDIKTQEKSLIVQIDSNESAGILDELKKNIPNSYVIRICMDSPYCIELNEEYMRNVDHHLNLMSEYVDKTKNFVKSDIFFCTLSESLYKFYQGDMHNKQYHAISLCSVKTKERAAFFGHLTDRNYTVFAGLDLHNIKKIKEIYQKTWFSLGHTMSCHDGIYKRSMKGYRDWIAPCTNTLIIYDDHVDIKKYFDDIIPTYTYGNIDSILDLSFKLISNPKKYIRFLEKQQEWLKNNTIEKQLLPLIKPVLN